MHLRSLLFVTAAMLIVGCRNDYDAVPELSTGTEGPDDTTSDGSDASSSEDGSTDDDSSESGFPDLGEEGDSTDETGSDELPPPVAWYRFDGALFDASGNDHDAQDPLGGASFESSPSGMALRLEPGSHLVVPTLGADLDASSELTVVVSLWVDLDNTQDVIFSLGEGGSEEPAENLTMMHLFEGRSWLLTETDSGSNNSYDLAPSPAIGAWTTVAWVLDGNEVAFFQDGIERGRQPYQPADSAPLRGFIGGAVASQTLDGLIDELAVFDAALADPALPD